MQGNKKCTDGFSDTSSIGSVLDDADREVSTLTDRAFRSLCISEDMSFNDPDLARSPDITHQVTGSLHRGTVSHAHRKSGIWSQLPSQGTEHAGWAATVQQLPKYVQGEGKYPKGSPPPTPVQRRLEAQVSGLRGGNKPTSKVSSLIKSFDSTESQCCDSRPTTSKPPALKHPPKFAPLPESGVNFCFDSAFLTVRRVPAEVSNPLQAGREHGEQESPENPETACRHSRSFLPTPNKASGSLEPRFLSPPTGPAQGEPGRGQEWMRKGTFLHSENSAFQSWKVHQPRLSERRDSGETGPESKAPRRHGETHPAEGNVSPSQGRASCSQEETWPAAGALSTSGSWEPRDAGAPVSAMEGNAPGSQPDPPVKMTQPPWRKPKPGKGRREHLREAPEEKQPIPRGGPALCRKQNPPGQFPESNVLDVPMDPKLCYDPPFNISKLLTPVIPTKSALDSSDGQPVEATPSPPGQPNGYQEKEPGECQSRDSYKSKASSLLFSLKDVRKCVKSTYSPSPLSRGPDEKTRGKVDGKQETVSNGVPFPNGLEENPLNELSEEKPPGAPPGSFVGMQKDPKTDASSSSAGDHLTCSSPPAITFCVNGEPIEMNSYEKDNANRDPEISPTGSGWCPDSGGHSLRKRLSLKLCGQEPEVSNATEVPRGPWLENGFSRSVSQEMEPEREAGLQNRNFNQKVSPGPLSPEEEDVFYSDSQSDFIPGLKMKTKFSTSSSDQSFASFDDQQKTWFTESQREGRRAATSADESQKDEKEEAMGKDALGDGRTCVEEKGEGERPPRAGEGLSVGRRMKSCAEEAHFRGTWSGGSQDTALSQAKELPTSPSSTSNKLILFAIKDNTLRATPVIKPIMLPLLRTLSSEDSPGGGHKEESLPRPSENASFYPPESHESPCSLTPSHLLPASGQGAQWRHTACRDAEATARRGPFQPATKGTLLSPPLAGDGESMGAGKDGQRRSTHEGKPATPRHIPTIALPEGDGEDEPGPHQPGPGREEQMQSSQNHFLSVPRAGPPGRRPVGRRPVPGEMAASPDPSSPEESEAYSPATSGVWDDVSQVPGELGWLPEEGTPASSWASHGPAQTTKRELLTHALVWEAGDPQLEAAAEDLRALSPRGSLPDAVTSSAGLPEKAEAAPVQPERAAGKPPVVPPKTEKALRRAKKLANKRRKTAQMQERDSEPRGERLPLQDSEWTEPRPQSPGEIPLPNFPVVRALPPSAHRHSVSGFSELVRRWPGEPPSATPLPPYPATQKVLQDPQSGEYFIFDLPVQVKIKTFYDPDTGKYVKVSIPSLEGDSSEPPSQDELAAACTLYPTFQPLPVTSLMLPRCSSQLSAPTFPRQGPHIPRVGGSHQSLHDTDARQRAPWPYGDGAQHSASQKPDGLPQSPEKEEGEAPSLEIISTDDLEDFATEGIS
ncbi:cardiac-enriched FHL2-interacting protein [Choloepus didactylus]|uniref:cardiac-enriched FHL2-interacting protein n=1 Tax=Choloepus didactylus TaxID=27675 RepID=UPI00189E6304|nr:cardiac-enriched FHL2-interacting protein [Choloepus didactylus]